MVPAEAQPTRPCTSDARTRRAKPLGFGEHLRAVRIEDDLQSLRDSRRSMKITPP